MHAMMYANECAEIRRMALHAIGLHQREDVPRVLLGQGEVIVGIRPEHLYLDGDGPLQMEAALAEPLGANTLLHGSLKQSGQALTASLSGIHQLSPSEQTLKLAVAEEHIHIFDKTTGQRIDAQ